MPNVRVEIFNRVAEDLRLQARKADWDYIQNKEKIKALVKEQQYLKKKRSELHRLSYEFSGKAMKGGGDAKT